VKVRYYADAAIREWHEHAVRSLRRLHDEHGIPVEIDRIDDQHGSIPDFLGDVRYSTPETVYERDLKHNRALTAVIEQPPSKAYKRDGELDIAGNVAVVDDGGIVRWASTLPGYADRYRPDAESRTAIDFLDDVVSSPSNRVCVECLTLLDGDETFCPNCGHDLP